MGAVRASLAEPDNQRLDDNAVLLALAEERRYCQSMARAPKVIR